jgi:hypothetical protein
MQPLRSLPHSELLAVGAVKLPLKTGTGECGHTTENYLRWKFNQLFVKKSQKYKNI